MTLKNKAFENIVTIGGNSGNQHFFSFFHNVFYPSEKNFCSSIIFILTSANTFNLDQSKILSLNIVGIEETYDNHYFLLYTNIVVSITMCFALSKTNCNISAMFSVTALNLDLSKISLLAKELINYILKNFDRTFYRKKYLFGQLLALLAVWHILGNICTTILFLYTSRHNYPGGLALYKLHQIEASKTGIYQLITLQAILRHNPI